MTGDVIADAAPLAATPPACAPLGTLWRAALLRYGYDASACLLLALPLRNATVASGIAALPDAAQAFHVDGGLWLLEVLVSQRASLAASLLPVFWSALLLSALALLPEWWLLRELALASGEPAVPARRALTRLSALACATWSLRGALWVAGFLFASFARSRLQQVPDERMADLVAAGVLASTLPLQLGVSLLRDLVAVLLVQRSRRVLAALRAAAQQLRAQVAPLTGTYAVVRVLGLAVLLGAHTLSVTLDQRGHGGLCLLVVLLGLGLRVALGALWLRWLTARAA